MDQSEAACGQVAVTTNPRRLRKIDASLLSSLSTNPSVAAAGPGKRLVPRRRVREETAAPSASRGLDAKPTPRYQPSGPVPGTTARRMRQAPNKRC